MVWLAFASRSAWSFRGRTGLRREAGNLGFGERFYPDARETVE